MISINYCYILKSSLSVGSGLTCAVFEGEIGQLPESLRVWCNEVPHPRNLRA